MIIRHNKKYLYALFWLYTSLFSDISLNIFYSRIFCPDISLIRAIMSLLTLIQTPSKDLKMRMEASGEKVIDKIEHRRKIIQYKQGLNG